ncbi:hypothetical protein M422DRAFT_57267 [Sphaerobolus stellatus SS14]|nr:hypothetical protein M422DRAFT_57267 [Sphaerobolus stellatus SS14]
MSDAVPAPVSANDVPQQTPQAVEEEAPGHKVFAGNLAYSTTNEGLQAFFESVATEILSAQVIQRGTRSAGYGFVSFATLEAAEKAVAALNQKELDGRTVIVEVAKPADQKDKERSERRAKRRAGRRGSRAPPGEVTEAEANGESAEKPEDAAKDAAAPAKPKKKRNVRKKAKKGPKSDTDAPAAAATDATAPPAENEEAAAKKKAARPQRKRTPRPTGEAPVGEPSKTVLFVANLGFNVDDNGLSEIFKSNDINVVSARVVRKRWGNPRKSKGYGFVDVGSEEEQQKALAALQGKEVDGRELAVKVAFLAAAAPPKPLTYAERRKEAQRVAEIKNAQNRKKSRRELEEESRQEALSKSLFEKAQEEEQAGTKNKAMAMMLKMGYKPGQTLGRIEEPATATTTEAASSSRKTTGHLVEPIAIDIWAGRQGVGKRKRPVSPKAAAKLAKIVQTAADEDARGSFRERARMEYEERRANGRLVTATRTCFTLDQKAGKEFNILWLNPQDPETFPSDLLEALTTDPTTLEVLHTDGVDDAERLRKQMRADALQPLAELEDENTATEKPALTAKDALPPEVVEEARQFISANAPKRLEMVLEYLRAKYFYCFWCGTQYTDLEDLQRNCPGLTEEDHD